MTKIKLLRIEQDLTCIKVALATGINPGTITSIERKNIKASENVRRKLSEFYGVTEKELFDDERFAI